MKATAPRVASVGHHAASMSAATIALQLERDRLEHRVRRIELVTSALRDRAVYRHAVMGTTPLPLRAAIEDFEIELAAMRRRLNELHRSCVEPAATRALRSACAT